MLLPGSGGRTSPWHWRLSLYRDYKRPGFPLWFENSRSKNLKLGHKNDHSRSCPIKEVVEDNLIAAPYYGSVCTIPLGVFPFNSDQHLVAGHVSQLIAALRETVRNVAKEGLWSCTYTLYFRKLTRMTRIEENQPL